MEIDPVHLAVLGGFHDFGGAIGYLHIQESLYGIADGLGIGDYIL